MATPRARLTIELDAETIVETLRKYGRVTIAFKQQNSGTILAEIEETGQIVGKTETNLFLNLNT